MSISINCKLSLSKKLRALIGTEASLTLVSEYLVDGKGMGILTLHTLNDDNADHLIKPEEIGETSIMLVPSNIVEESPNASSPSHASIFSTVPQKGKVEAVVRKVAAVNAPEEGEESSAIKDADIPKAFPEMKQKEFVAWVKNVEELVNAVNKAKNKQSTVDPESAGKNTRQKAILQEIKDREEAIDLPAWIVNDKSGVMSINDLNITLPFNAPYDLSNISAKRIAASKDLRDVIKAGYVKFISPVEKDQYVLKTLGEAEKVGSLDIFDNHEQALDSIGNMVQDGSAAKNPVIDEKSAMTVTEEDIDVKTEDESMILNLTQNAPIVREKRIIDNTARQSSHTNAPESTPRPSNPNIRPIRKKE